MRRIEQQSVKRMVAGELVNAERSLAGTLAKNAGKHASRRGWSVFKRMTRFFKGAVSNVGKGAKGVGKSVTRTWRGLKKVPHATWQKVYRASRGLMWIRYGVHTIRDKGPDFVVGVADDAGKLLGKMFNSMMTAGGELIKSAVREALGGGVRGETLIGRIIQGFVAAVLLLLAVAVLIPKKAVTVLIPKESGQGN